MQKLIKGMTVAFVCCLIATLLILSGCGGSDNTKLNPINNELALKADVSKDPAGLQNVNSGNESNVLKLHFLDVGNADCILIQTPSAKTILIDAGNRDDGEQIKKYLHRQGVAKIDILIATHPHEDHIGGMQAVVEEFPVGEIYMPRVAHTSKVFEELLLAIQQQGLHIKTAKAGVSLLTEQDLNFTIIAPLSREYEQLNDYSVVTRLVYGNTAFLLTGDAEAVSENEMLAAGTTLQTDVLKVGHHGSVSSTTIAFLKAVKPRYAVISVGKDNDYGHPHQETLAKLEKAKVKLYRTDVCGTIIATSDGRKIKFAQEKNEVKVQAKNAEVKYIGNKNSHKFHRLDCSSLPQPQNREYFSTRQEAVNAGYTPCGSCKP